ncbi:MAG: XRE family transcriptional regulator [Treponema sp.]|jgi:putative transcriptional regulator|nr:XRE family transcriptional regulator [Treponema sp.]
MKYKSEIFEVIHQDAAANFEIGAISAAEMREFDEMCLVQEPEPAKETVETTEMEHISPVTAGI